MEAMVETARHRVEGWNILLPTLPETNIAPQNGPSQKKIHLPTINFQGLC